MSSAANRAFRSWAYTAFKNEFSHLSRTHWHVSYALRVTADVLSGVPSGSPGFVGHVRSAPGFDPQRLGITAERYLEGEDDIINHLRVLLLVKGVSALETLIHRYVELKVAAMGHVEAGNELSRAGKALAKPGMVSNIVPSGSYLQHLLAIRFPDPLTTKLSKSYQLRCLAAHNGGVVDDSAIKQFPAFATRRGEQIHLTWPDLHEYLEAIADAAKRYELGFPAPELKRVENQWLIKDLVDRNPRITASEVRARLTSDFRRQSMSSKYLISRKFGVPLG